MSWNELTNKDREEVLASMPGAIDGFLKGWGWLQFAQAIEERCRAKNEAPETSQVEFEVYAGDNLEAGSSGPRHQALAEARNYAMQYLDDTSVVRIEEVRRSTVERFVRLPERSALK